MHAHIHVATRLRRYFTVLLVVAALLLPLARAAASAAEIVETGYLPVLSFAPIFLATDKGYFKEAGIEVQLIRFASGAKMMDLSFLPK